MKGRGSKRKGQLLHSTRRALERHGLEQIQTQDPRALPLGRRTLRISVWEVYCAKYDRKLRVCYDKIRKTIATVLPA